MSDIKYPTSGEVGGLTREDLIALMPSIVAMMRSTPNHDREAWKWATEQVLSVGWPMLVKKNEERTQKLQEEEFRRRRGY